MTHKWHHADWHSATCELTCPQPPVKENQKLRKQETMRQASYMGNRLREAQANVMARGERVGGLENQRVERF